MIAVCGAIYAGAPWILRQAPPLQNSPQEEGCLHEVNCGGARVLPAD
jgi:hypothetical protein